MFSILWHWASLCWRKIGQFCNSHALGLSKRKFNKICVYILMQSHCFLKCLKSLVRGEISESNFSGHNKMTSMRWLLQLPTISGSQEDSLYGWAKESGQDRPSHPTSHLQDAPFKGASKSVCSTSVGSLVNGRPWLADLCLGSEQSWYPSRC